MGKASRTKRKRAAVRSAKRTRTNTWWYGLTAIVVIAGVSLIVYAHETAPTPVGPYIADQVNVTNPHNKDSHWHAALGVFDCNGGGAGQWLGDTPGSGIWNWPFSTPTGNPARAGNTGVYAGMHSHDDGIIHMEPSVNEEAGRHATLGKYFEFGGWKLSATSFDFLGHKEKNGDKCGSAAGTLTWATATFKGKVSDQQRYTLRTGDPSNHKVGKDEIIIVAFLPPGKTAVTLGNPPSLAKLPDAASADTAGANSTVTTMPSNTPTTMPPIVTTPSTVAATPTTKKP